MERIPASSEIVITSDALLQVIRDHFQQISPVQWALLANGTWDIETRQIIRSMCAQLVQTVSSNVLQLFIPKNEVRMRCATEEGSIMAFRAINTVLVESIGLVFARALNLPSIPKDVDLNNDSQELTFLIETEVSHKVNSILSEASVRAHSGAIRVTSALSSAAAELGMVDRAKQCLRTCLNAVKCSCATSRSVTNSPVTARTDEPPAQAASEGQIYERKKGPCHCCFSIFARKKFRKMQENIATSVPLLSEIMTPGSSPANSTGSSIIEHSPVTTPSVTSRKSSPEASPRKPSRPTTPEEDYEDIRKDVDKMFRELQMDTPSGSAPSQQRLNEYLQSSDMKKFSEKLHEMMYTAALTSSPPNDTLKTNLHQAIQEEVESYVKNLSSFMQQDPSDDLYKFDLFEMCMQRPSPPPVTSQASVPSPISGSFFYNPRMDIFERSMVHPGACVPSFISADVPAIVLRTPPMEPEQSPKAGIPSFISADVPAIVLYSPQITQNHSQTSVKSQLTKGQNMIKTMIMTLLQKIFNNAPLSQKDPALFRSLVDRLTQKAWQEIDIKDNEVKKAKKILQKVVKDVKKDLKDLFGSSMKITDRLVNVEDYDDIVVQLVKSHYQKHFVKKPSRLSRAFEFICEAFSCCIN